MNKICTSVEQSKKLIELGIDVNTADMCYRYYSGGIITGYGDCVLAKSFITGKNVIRENDLPCWSLATLIDIIENIDKSQKVEVSFTHNGGKYWVDVHFDEFGSFCQDNELYESKIDALIAIIKKFKNRNLL